ncbi:MAG: hypothetical protein H8E66_17870 [Planctomycetes bacterium]|nr:hypothetical protein [Planctomycetota bacterium]
MRACCSFMVLFAALTLAACGKPKPAASNAAPSRTAPETNDPEVSAPVPAAPATPEIKRIDPPSLPLSEYLPPLDGGRIEIGSPVDWKPMPRDSKYVVRFHNESRNSLPRIDVVVEENSLGGFDDVTEANVGEFTAAVAKDLEASKTVILEPPIPMVIGSVPCARYVSNLKLKIGEGTILVERQTLALLHGGRFYKINLLVMPNKLNESRDAAYAICAGLRFPAEESVGE